MDVVWSVGYVLAWRVFLRLDRRPKRRRDVPVLLAFSCGLMIGEWWAVALGCINALSGLLVGPRVLDSKSARTPRWSRGRLWGAAALAVGEAAFIATGVAFSHLFTLG